MYPYYPIEVYKIEKYKYMSMHVTHIYPRVGKRRFYGYIGHSVSVILMSMLYETYVFNTKNNEVQNLEVRKKP